MSETFVKVIWELKSLEWCTFPFLYSKGVITPGKYARFVCLFVVVVWCSSLSNCPFCKWTRNCKQNHMCAKVIHPLVHPFNRTRVCLEPDRDHLFSWVSVRLFGPHPSVMYSHLPKRSAPRGKLEFNSIEEKETGVNTP